jgi:hypothetical protein
MHLPTCRGQHFTHVAACRLGLGHQHPGRGPAQQVLHFGGASPWPDSDHDEPGPFRTQVPLVNLWTVRQQHCHSFSRTQAASGQLAGAF